MNKTLCLRAQCHPQSDSITSSYLGSYVILYVQSMYIHHHLSTSTSKFTYLKTSAIIQYIYMGFFHGAWRLFHLEIYGRFNICSFSSPSLDISWEPTEWSRDSRFPIVPQLSTQFRTSAEKFLLPTVPVEWWITWCSPLLHYITVYYSIL
jgi:hypothetical protein